MTIPGAVALTAVVITIAALVGWISTDASGLTYRQRARRSRTALALAVLAMCGYIAAIWLEVLT